MSSYEAPAGIHLQNLILDKTTTAEQKADCLKLLKVVLKNLADPVKSQDPKYRQLKLENAKVASKILPCPSSMEYLKAIGFVQVLDESDGAKVLRVVETTNVSLMAASLQEVSNGLAMVAPKDDAKKIVKKHRIASPVEEKKEDTIRNKLVVPPVVEERLSEKQKANRMMEQKRDREREEAKLHRKKTAALIKKDKFVRENDENWTSQPSAACNKAGKGISTFRDNFGEE
eukprot:CAMPEP_0119015240 /NCGR_PEP_ID=MMETSP1176-20130426/10664_1 /TAXON_ID=265551 /ORGANISM="Synedropsis recta cf, Strain CCMP1620" /LENGTH=229 /DNA_ID=CAMNT_0006968517 /DNA_START=86 /DNA_END=775 /DNA_ORIENTATION=+